MTSLEQTLALGLWAFLVAFVRFGTALMLLPGFGESALPQRVRLVCAVTISGAVALSGHVWAGSMPTSPSLVVFALVGEFLVGAMIGTVGRTMMSAVHFGGTLIAQQAGFSSLFASMTGLDAGTGLTGYLTAASIAFLFAVDAHHVMIETLWRSYEAFPAGRLPAAWDSAQTVVTTISEAVRLGVQLATPFLLLGFLLNIGLAFVNRAMPNMQVFFVGQPIAVLGGFVLLGLTVGGMLSLVADRLASALYALW